MVTEESIPLACNVCGRSLGLLSPTLGDGSDPSYRTYSCVPSEEPPSLYVPARQYHSDRLFPTLNDREQPSCQSGAHAPTAACSSPASWCLTHCRGRNDAGNGDDDGVETIERLALRVGLARLLAASMLVGFWRRDDDDDDETRLALRGRLI